MEAHKNNLSKNVLTLLIGTTFAQILGIIISPILTRLYGPESFGIFAIFTSITSIIAVVICLRYECAIVLPESDGDAANVLAACFIFIFIITLFSIPIVFFGNSLLSQALNAPEIEKYLILIPISIFFMGCFLAFNYWNTRTKNFKRLAYNRILSSSVSSGSQLGAGLTGHNNGGGLIFGSIISQFLGSFFLGVSIWREDKKILKGSITKKGIFHNIKRYKNFALFDSWAELLNTISWQLPVFLLALFFSPVIVGLYSLGLRILQFPMNLIGGALSQVFYPRAVEVKSDGAVLSNLVEKFFGTLVVVGLFPCLLLTLVGGDLFAVIFGEQWREAGTFAQILGFWAFIWFISSPMSTLYYVFEKQKEFSYFTIINLATRFGSLIIGGILGNVYVALALFALSGIVVYGYLCITVMKYSKISWIVLKKMLISNIVFFTPFGIFIICLKIFNFNSLIIVSISGIVVIIYYLYVIRTNLQVREALNEISFFKILIDKKIL